MKREEDLIREGEMKDGGINRQIRVKGRGIKGVGTRSPIQYIYEELKRQFSQLPIYVELCVCMCVCVYILELCRFV